MHRKVNITTDFDKFLQAKYKDPDTPINLVDEMKDIYDAYGGFPKSYVFENTCILQTFWNEDECDYQDLGDQLGIDVVTVSSIMQQPGNTIPLHRDTFFQLRKRFPNQSTKSMVRANIFLEDWKDGHFLQYDDVVDSNWKQGDGHMWDSEVLHIGANNGLHNKFTLQVSGFLRS